MSVYIAPGEAPCWATGDHYWHGSICSSCGARLRCICGQFWKGDDAHFAVCPVLKDCPEAEYDDE